jgi:hypothetical protein
MSNTGSSGRAGVDRVVPYAVKPRPEVGPWRVEARSPYSSMRRSFWVITRYHPGRPFNLETVMTRTGARRWYDEGKAIAECAKLNGTAGVQEVPRG